MHKSGAYDARDPQFESSHEQFVFAVNCFVGNIYFKQLNVGSEFQTHLHSEKEYLSKLDYNNCKLFANWTVKLPSVAIYNRRSFITDHIASAIDFTSK